MRQGDPISSLLFVLVMDVLSKLLDEGAMNRIFRLHSMCDDPLITHISFADDVLVLQWSGGISSRYPLNYTALQDNLWSELELQ